MKAPHRGCNEQRQQRFRDARQDHLRLGIPESCVEFDHLWTGGGQHEPDVQNTTERMTLGGHPAHHGLHDLVHAARLQRLVHERARRERAHPAGVRPLVVVEDTLVVLREPMGSARSPSLTTKNDTSGPARHSSTTDGRRLRQSSALSSRRRRRTRFRAIGGDNDALPCRESIRLEDERKSNSPERTHASASSAVSHVRNRAVGTPCRVMKAFAKALLDSSRAARAVGPKMSRFSSAKRSTTPRLSGSSGPTTVMSI